MTRVDTRSGWLALAYGCAAMLMLTASLCPAYAAEPYDGPDISTADAVAYLASPMGQYPANLKLLMDDPGVGTDIDPNDSEPDLYLSNYHRELMSISGTLSNANQLQALYDYNFNIAFSIDADNTQAIPKEDQSSNGATFHINLSPTLESQFTPELLKLAYELNYDPAQIYNWVRKNIKYERYTSCRKGAHVTLMTNRGNEWDQSSLMVALLRISGIPARYSVNADYQTGAKVVLDDGFSYGARKTLVVTVEAWMPQTSVFFSNAEDKSTWISFTPWLEDTVESERLAVVQAAASLPSNDIGDISPSLPNDLDLNAIFDEYLLNDFNNVEEYRNSSQLTLAEHIRSSLRDYIADKHAGRGLTELQMSEQRYPLSHELTVVPYTQPVGFNKLFATGTLNFSGTTGYSTLTRTRVTDHTLTFDSVLLANLLTTTVLAQSFSSADLSVFVHLERFSIAAVDQTTGTITHEIENNSETPNDSNPYAFWYGPQLAGRDVTIYCRPVSSNIILGSPGISNDVLSIDYELWLRIDGTDIIKFQKDLGAGSLSTVLFNEKIDTTTKNVTSSDLFTTGFYPNVASANEIVYSTPIHAGSITALAFDRLLYSDESVNTRIADLLAIDQPFKTIFDGSTVDIDGTQTELMAAYAHLLKRAWLSRFTADTLALAQILNLQLDARSFGERMGLTLVTLPPIGPAAPYRLAGYEISDDDDSASVFSSLLIHPAWRIDARLLAASSVLVKVNSSPFPDNRYEVLFDIEATNPTVGFYHLASVASGSFNESAIFEDFQGTPALSSVRSLLNARNPDDYVGVTDVVSAVDIPSALPQSIKDEISADVAAGFRVFTPNDLVSVNLESDQVAGSGFDSVGQLSFNNEEIKAPFESANGGRNTFNPSSAPIRNLNEIKTKNGNINSLPNPVNGLYADAVTANQVVDPGTGDFLSFINERPNNLAAITTVGDPVNPVTGEMYLPEQADIRVKTRGALDLAVVREYRSQLIYDGPFGYGWAWNHGESLVFIEDNAGHAGTDAIKYFDSRRSAHDIRLDDSSGDPQYPAGSPFELITNSGDPDAAYRIVYFEGSLILTFDELGRLRTKEDFNGNALTFEYAEMSTTTGSDADKRRLEKIIGSPDGATRYLEFVYGADEYVDEVIEHYPGLPANDRRKAVYQYDTVPNGAKVLTKVWDVGQDPTDPDACYQYEYEVGSQLDNQLLRYNMTKQVRPNGQPGGDWIEFFYYKNDKVSHHVNQLGDTTHFQYSDLNRYAEVWNEAGYYRKVFWNRTGDVVRITNRDRSVVTREYDDHHRMTAEVNGNGFRTTYHYEAPADTGDRVRTGPIKAEREVGVVGDGSTAPLHVQEFIYDDFALTDENGTADPDGITFVRKTAESMPYYDSDGPSGVWRAWYWEEHVSGAAAAPVRGNLATLLEGCSPPASGTPPPSGSARSQEAMDMLDGTTGYAALVGQPERYITRMRYQHDAFGNIKAERFDHHADYFTGDETGLEHPLTQYSYATGGFHIGLDLDGVVRGRAAASGDFDVDATPGAPRRAIQMTYGSHGRLVKRDTLDVAGGAAVVGSNEFEYNDYDQVSRAFDDTNKGTVRTNYDELRRVVSVVDARADASSETDFTQHFAYWPTAFYVNGGDRIQTTTDSLGFTTENTYDTKGDLIAVTDRRGNTTRFAYDGMHRVVETIDPLGHVTRVRYDGAGNRTAVLTDQTFYRDANDGMARTGTTGTWSFYDGLNRKIYEIVDAGDTGPYRAVRWEYDAFGNVTKAVRGTTGTHPDQFQPAAPQFAALDNTDHRYDELGRLIQTVEQPGDGADSRRTSFRYDGLGRLAETTQNASGEAPATLNYNATAGMSWTFGGAANSSSEQDRTTYNVFGEAEVQQRIDFAAGNPLLETVASEVQREYDPRGFMVEERVRRTEIPHDKVFEIQPSNPVGQIVLHLFGEADYVSDQFVRRFFEYDTAGRVTATWQFVRDDATVASNSALLSRHMATVPAGYTVHQTLNSYDNAGDPVRVERTVGGAWNAANGKYDGNIVGSQETVYNLRGEVASTTNELGFTQFFAYDRDGNLKSSTDFEGYETLTQYDALDRVVAVTAPDGGRTSYDFDELGRVTAVTDPLGRRSQTDYNGFGEAVRQTDPLGHETEYTYDTRGRQVKVTDPRGIETFLAYNDVDELTERYTAVAASAPGSPPSQLTTALNYVDSTAGQPGQLGYSPADEHVVVTRFAYDVFGRMTQQAQGVWPSILSSYIVGDTLAHKIATYVTYNALGQDIHTETTPPPSGGPPRVAVRRYYDEVGNLIRQDDTDGVDPPTLVGQGNIPNPAFTGEDIAHPDSRTTFFFYDELNRPIRTWAMSGEVSSLGLVDHDSRTRYYDDWANTPGVSPLYGFSSASASAVVSEDPFGVLTRAEFDKAGRLIGQAAGFVGSDTAAGSAVTFDHDRRGLVVAENPPNTVPDARTFHRYDAVGRLIETRRQHATETESVWGRRYDRAGQLLEETDPNGHVTRYGYDAAGRNVLVTQAAESSADASMLKYGYDAAGQLTHLIPHPYVEPGRPGISATEASRALCTYAYDALGRQVTKTEADPDGGGSGVSDVWRRFYDAHGNLVVTLRPIHENNNTGAAGSAVVRAYDGVNRLTHVYEVAPGGGTPELRRELGYDFLSRVVKATEYHGDDGGVGHRDWELNHNRILRRYDFADRVIREMYPDRESATVFEGDPGATQNTANIAKFRIDRNYIDEIDPNNTTLSRRVDVTYARSILGANPANPVNGRRVRYAYDRKWGAFNKVETAAASISDNWLILAKLPDSGADDSYDDLGRVIHAQIQPDGPLPTDLRLAYDRQGRQRQRDYQRFGTSLFRQELRYDRAGNVLTQARTIPASDGGEWVANYTYDDRDRLTAAHDAAWGYDERGRMTQQVHRPNPAALAGVTTTTADFVHDERGRLTGATVNGAANAAFHFHTADGHLQVSVTAGPGLGPAPGDAFYAYDWNDRLVYVARYLDADGDGNADGTPTPVARYVYDAFDRLIARVELLEDSAGQTVTRFVPDGDRLAEIYEGTEDAGGDAYQWTWTAVRSYAYGSGRDDPVAMIDETVAQNPLRGPPGPATDELAAYGLLRDHRGDVALLLDPAGRIAERYDYDAWGRWTVRTPGADGVWGTPDDTYARDGHHPGGDGLAFTADDTYHAPSGNLLGFTGRWWMPHANAWQIRARWYRADLKRWLSPDPLGFVDGMNRYAYAKHNPLRFVDPSGLIVRTANDIGIANPAALGRNDFRPSLRHELSQLKFDRLMTVSLSPEQVFVNQAFNEMGRVGQKSVDLVTGIPQGVVATKELTNEVLSAGLVTTQDFFGFGDPQQTAAIQTRLGNTALAVNEAVTSRAQSIHNNLATGNLIGIGRDLQDTAFLTLEALTTRRIQLPGQGPGHANVGAPETGSPLDLPIGNARLTLDASAPDTRLNTPNSSNTPYANPPAVPGGTVQRIDPNDLSFSQRTAGGNGRADQLRQSMATRGWDGPPVDAVRTPDGRIVTIDNTRVAIARDQGITEIPVRVFNPSDPLPTSMTGRFGSAKTWGEALIHRTGHQRPPLPPTGTPDSPRMPGGG